MPKRFQRTRKLRRASVRTPSRRISVHLRDKLSGFRRCGWCGRVLQGIARDSMTKTSKSEKRVSRRFGGYLCHKCLERALKFSIISEWKTIEAT